MQPSLHDLNSKCVLTTKWLKGDKSDPHFPRGFYKNPFSRESVKPCSFVTFNIIISHTFSESLFKISQLVQKIWKFSSSRLTILINFGVFYTFPCYKKTNEARIKQMMSAFFFYLQSTSIRLLDSCLKS